LSSQKIEKQIKLTGLLHMHMLCTVM